MDKDIKNEKVNIEKKNASRKKKKRASTFLLVAIFLVGLLVLMYPIISRLYYNVESSYEINDFDKEAAKLDDTEVKRRIELARAFNDSLVNHIDKDPYTDEQKAAGRKEYARMLEINERMGHVEVPKINVDIPMYAGTEEEVLQKGVGHLEGTSLPVGGIDTHTVLTAHCGLPTAKLFTDLEKLEEGDVFYVHNLAETLAYKVVQIKVVNPDEFDDLLVVKGHDYATLLTCTPYMINTHRLLVRGERIPYDAVEDIVTARENKEIFKYKNRFFIALGVIALLLLLILTTRHKKKRYKKAIRKLLAMNEKDSNDKPDDEPDDNRPDDGGDDNPPPDGPGGGAPGVLEPKEPSAPVVGATKDEDEPNEPEEDSNLDSFQAKSDSIKSDEYVENGGEDVSFLKKLKNIMVEPDEDEEYDDFDEVDEEENKKSDKKEGIKGWDDDTAPEDDTPKEINIDSEPVIERKTAYDDEALKAETEKKLFKDEPKPEKDKSDKKSGSFFQKFSKKKAKESIFTDEDLNINQEERRLKAKRLAKEAEERIESERENLKKIATKSKIVKETEKQPKKKVSKIDSADPKALEMEFKRLREETRLENERIEKNRAAKKDESPIEIDSKKVDKNSRVQELKDISEKNLKKDFKDSSSDYVKPESKKVEKKEPVKTATEEIKKDFEPVSNVRVPKNTDETMNFEKIKESAREELSKEKGKESEVNPNHIIREVETEAQRQARLAAEDFDRMMAERRKKRTSDKSVIDMKLSEEEDKLQKLADLFTGDGDNN